MAKGGYGVRKYVRVPLEKLKGSGLDYLQDDSQRWRWLKFYALSDVKTFPGLVGAIGEPMKGLEIVGAIYTEKEVDGDVGLAESLGTWDDDIKKFVEAGLVRECFVERKRYYWNVDFHVDQDYDSGQGTARKLVYRYYNAFLELLSDRQRAIFLLLLSEFRPRKVDLGVFGIPAVTKVLSGFIVGREKRTARDADGDEVRRLRILMEKSIGTVKSFVTNDRKEQGVEGYEDFVEYFVKDNYEKTRNRKYHFSAKDGYLVKRLLKTFGLKELKRLVDLFFASKDKFICKSGYSIGAFSSVVNSLGRHDVRYVGNFDIED